MDTTLFDANVVRGGAQVTVADRPPAAAAPPVSSP
jgi:hypothetical protein